MMVLKVMARSSRIQVLLYVDQFDPLTNSYLIVCYLVFGTGFDNLKTFENVKIIRGRNDELTWTAQSAGDGKQAGW